MKGSMDQPEITFLSLGWGVQSFTIAAMAVLKEIAPIDLAVHADTGHEAQGTYDHARRWTAWLEEGEGGRRDGLGGSAGRG